MVSSHMVDETEETEEKEKGDNDDDGDDDEIQIQLLCSVLKERSGHGVMDVPAFDSVSLHAFLLEHRININIRQVLPDGVDVIPGKQKT